MGSTFESFHFECFTESLSVSEQKNLTNRYVTNKHTELKGWDSKLREDSSNILGAVLQKLPKLLNIVT